MPLCLGSWTSPTSPGTASRWLDFQHYCGLTIWFGLMTWLLPGSLGWIPTTGLQSQLQSACLSVSSVWQFHKIYSCLAAGQSISILIGFRQNLNVSTRTNFSFTYLLQSHHSWRAIHGARWKCVLFATIQIYALPFHGIYSSRINPL